jgi:1-acyl-sn-glycerol-3-phosphate acyltransferase
MKILILFRSIVMTLLFPFTVIVLGPIAMLGHYLFQNRQFDDFILQLWGKTCCRMANVKVVVEGLENIPKSGCLFLFTHTSFFDVFAMAGYIKGLRFGAKAELFKIPIFAQAMKAMGTLPIARDNREKVYQIYQEAKERFAKGEQFALSPEGGRFYNPQQLSPFKAGPFIFAMSAEAPVVPMIILGAYEALPKGGFLFNKSKWSHTIRIIILKQVETKNFNSEQRKDLQALVYSQMNAVWQKENKIS